MSGGREVLTSASGPWEGMEVGICGHRPSGVWDRGDTGWKQSHYTKTSGGWRGWYHAVIVQGGERLVKKYVLRRWKRRIRVSLSWRWTVGTVEALQSVSVDWTALRTPYKPAGQWRRPLEGTTDWSTIKNLRNRVGCSNSSTIFRAFDNMIPVPVRAGRFDDLAHMLHHTLQRLNCAFPTNK